MIRLRGVVAAALVAVALPACSDGGPTGDDRGVVTVRGEGGFARISNPRADAVYYFLVESEAAVVVEWTPCSFHLEACPHVHAGETLSIPYAQISGWEEGDDGAVLYWWHLTEVGSSLQVGEVRAIPFPLR